MKDYRPAPFWFLNHKLEKPELSRQIQLMKQAGVSGFFMHPRAGLKTPYGSDEWYEIIHFICEEAAKQGLDSWLYDEDPFPSGIAGGRVVFDHPEFAARSLVITEISPDSSCNYRADLGTGELLMINAVRSVDGLEEVLDLTSKAGILREDYMRCEWNSSYYATLYPVVPYFHYRAETINPHLALDIHLEGEWRVFSATAEIIKDSDKHSYRPDNLNPECVRHFIDLTHERYADYCGDLFGNVVPGIFTDEPKAGGILPWTRAFPAYFEQSCGYNLLKNIHHLVADISGISSKVREDYWRTINKLYCESYYTQIHDWCSSHSLKSTGHILCEEDPVWQVQTGGNLYAYQRWCDIPGFDIVTVYIGDREHPALSFGGKLVSSAAHQQDKPVVMSECFGCTPYNFGIESMLKTAGWLYALGINWLIPHGYFYSLDGFRKDDAGKGFFFQDPTFDSQPYFNILAGRMGQLLAESKHLSRTAVLYQISAFQRALPADMVKAQELQARLYAVNQDLISAHIEFDYVDEATVMEMTVHNGLLVCGNEVYDHVIIPFPDDVAGDSEKAVQKLNKFDVKVIPAEGEFIDEVIAAGAVHTPVNIVSSKGNADDLMALRKRSGDCEIIYIFNNSSTGCVFELAENIDNNAYIYDPAEDVYLQIPDTDSVKIGLDGYKFAILILSDRTMHVSGEYLPSDKPADACLPAEKNPQWDYIPPIPVRAVISHWDVKICSGSDLKVYTNSRYCLIRDLYGTTLGYLQPGVPRSDFDTAPVIPSPYPVNAEYKTTFEIDSDIAVSTLVFESETFSGNPRIMLNDMELDLNDAQSELVYDPSNRTLDVSSVLQKGNNSIVLHFDNASEFAGLRSLIYVI